ncbi:hypothetical protein [cyanobacterium endosymbiont of Rhopalodia gibberula]|nr:hypothetical protein [cyanobacterium endosymbiont of Rhopalodia gibberula]
MNQTISLDNVRNRKIKDIVGADLTEVDFPGVSLPEVHLSKAS